MTCTETLTRGNIDRQLIRLSLPLLAGSLVQQCYNTVDLMINGAVPQWQNKGVSSIYHCAMSEKYIAAGTRWAITNPQIESNGPANVWAKYDSELFMRRRCFVKEL